MTFMELIAIIFGFISNGQNNEITNLMQQENISYREVSQFGVTRTQNGNHGATGAATYEYAAGNSPGAANGTGVDVTEESYRHHNFVYNPDGN